MLNPFLTSQIINIKNFILACETMQRKANPKPVWRINPWSLGENTKKKIQFSFQRQREICPPKFLAAGDWRNPSWKIPFDNKALQYNVIKSKTKFNGQTCHTVLVIVNTFNILSEFRIYHLNRHQCFGILQDYKL